MSVLAMFGVNPSKTVCSCKGERVSSPGVTFMISAHKFPFCDACLNSKMPVVERQMALSFGVQEILVYILQLKSKLCVSTTRYF